MSYTDFVNIALSALIVALSALIVVIAVVGIWGFKEIRNSAMTAAKGVVNETLADIVKEEVRKYMQFNYAPNELMRDADGAGVNTEVTRDE